MSPWLYLWFLDRVLVMVYKVRENGMPFLMRRSMHKFDFKINSESKQSKKKMGEIPEGGQE